MPRLSCYASLASCAATSPRKNGVYAGLSNFWWAVRKHEKALSHKSSAWSLSGEGKERIEMCTSKPVEKEIRRHNEKVDLKHKILCRLIGHGCFVGLHELAFWGHDELEASTNRVNLKDLAVFLGKYDEILHTHFASNNPFQGDSKTTQKNLIFCLADVWGMRSVAN